MSIFTKHPRAWCDHCGKRVLRSTLTGVQTMKATHSSPAEGEWWCEVCCEQSREAEAHAEEMRSLRGYSDEERERI